MPKRRGHKRLHVVRGDKVAPVERRARLRRVKQVDSGARAGPEQEIARAARLLDDPNDVADDGVLDGDALDLVAGRSEVGRSEWIEGLDEIERASFVVPAEDRGLLGLLRVGDDRLEKETVELGLGKRVGPLVLDRVLRRA